MTRKFRFLALTAFVFAGLTSDPATLNPRQRQSDDRCPAVAALALESAEVLCERTGRNEICYGNSFLDAHPQPGVADLNLDAEGDVTRLVLLRTLRLSPVDLDSESWGIALMRIQANMPDTVPADQNVTLVLFGETRVEDTAPDLPQIEVDVAIRRNANIRQLPSPEAFVVGIATPGEKLIATGRLEDEGWLRVRNPQSGLTGWMLADLLHSDEALDQLAVVEPGARYFGPMQAFAFESGSKDALCHETPNGLLIQTPEGMGEINFLINEVDIQIGSTILLRSQSGSAMTLDVLEGLVNVTLNGRVTQVVAGAELVIPLDEEGHPSGWPAPLIGYHMADVDSAPIGLLPREIVIHPPLTSAELAALLPPEPTPTLPPTSAPPPQAGLPSVEAAPPNPPAPLAGDSGQPATSTPIPSPTPTECPPPPPGWEPLRLTSMCSPAPDVYRVWRVRNSNGVPADFTWDVAGSPTGQSGSGTVHAANCGVPAEVFFNTNTEPGPNTVRLFVGGVQQDVKASNPAPCP